MATLHPEGLPSARTQLRNPRVLQLGPPRPPAHYRSAQIVGAPAAGRHGLGTEQVYRCARHGSPEACRAPVADLCLLLVAIGGQADAQQPAGAAAAAAGAAACERTPASARLQPTTAPSRSPALPCPCAEDELRKQGIQDDEEQRLLSNLRIAVRSGSKGSGGAKRAGEQPTFDPRQSRLHC